MSTKKNEQKTVFALKDIWAAAKQGKKQLLLMFFLDGAFILAFLLMGALFGLLEPTLIGLGLWYALLAVAIYCILLLLLYSFVKYIILRSLRTLFVTSVLDFGRFWKFYALNLCLFALFTIICSFLAYFIAAVKRPFADVVFVVLGIPCIILLFAILQGAHSAFHVKESGVWRSLLQGFTSLGKGRTYVKVIGVSVIALLGLLLVLFVAGLGIRSLSETNYALYVSLYGIFSIVAGSLMTVFAYLLLLFSRIGFYAAAMKEDHHVLPQP